jgi:hypothetical protein
MYGSHIDTLTDKIEVHITYTYYKTKPQIVKE